MKGFTALLLYHFRFQRPVSLLAGAGLALIALSLPATLLDGNLAFGLCLSGFVAVFLIPLLAAPTVLRQLIANSRLALVPGLPFQAGLAQFCLVLAAAAFLPLASLHNEVALSWSSGARIFGAISIYLGLMQLILPSPYMLQLIGLLPLLTLFLLRAVEGTTLAAWLLSEAGATLLALLALLGWLLALRMLATRSRYRPHYRAAEAADWLQWDGGILQHRQWKQAGHSAAGTLLLGYPDSLRPRLLPIANQALFSPLACILLLALIGFGEAFETVPPVQGMASYFLIFSGFGALLLVLRYDELAARGRLLWLRMAGDRQRFWQVMEREILFDGALLGAACALAALAVAMLVPTLRGAALHYWLLVITGGLFGLYFSLACQIQRWGNAVKILGWSLVGLVIGAAMSLARALDWPLLAFASEALLLALALLNRQLAQRGYGHIDWRLVQPKSGLRPRPA